MSHRPNYYATAFSHFATCSCGWRSRLHDTREEVEADFREHRRNTP